PSLRSCLRSLWSLCRFFFFSSRRRHTRSKRDWSSDVCSSDLPPWPPLGRCPLLTSSWVEHDFDHDSTLLKYESLRRCVLHRTLHLEKVFVRLPQTPRATHPRGAPLTRRPLGLPSHPNSLRLKIGRAHF